MLKPTVLYWIIAVSLFVSAKINKNGIKLMLAKEINLPDRVWQKLNFAWVCFFFIMGVANLVVATLVAKNYLNEFFWVKFKVFGGTFLTITFTILCGIIIYAYQKKFEKNNKNLKQV